MTTIETKRLATRELLQMVIDRAQEPNADPFEVLAFLVRERRRLLAEWRRG